MFIKYLNRVILFALTAYCSFLFASTNTLIVKPNQPEFSIQLQSNPTTGYSWSLKSYDKKLLSLIKHQYIKPTNHLIGATGYEIWIFKANSLFFSYQKTTSLVFSYERPWEKNMNTKQVIYQIMPEKKSH